MHEESIKRREIMSLERKQRILRKDYEMLEPECLLFIELDNT